MQLIGHLSSYRLLNFEVPKINPQSRPDLPERAAALRDWSNAMT